MYFFTGSHVSSMSILGLKIYILLKHPLYISSIKFCIKTVFPDPEAALIIDLVGHFETCSYLLCLT